MRPPEVSGGFFLSAISRRHLPGIREIGVFLVDDQPHLRSTFGNTISLHCSADVSDLQHKNGEDRARRRGNSRVPGIKLQN